MLLITFINVAVNRQIQLFEALSLCIYSSSKCNEPYRTATPRSVRTISTNVHGRNRCNEWEHIFVLLLAPLIVFILYNSLFTLLWIFVLVLFTLRTFLSNPCPSCANDDCNDGIGFSVDSFRMTPLLLLWLQFLWSLCEDGSEVDDIDVDDDNNNDDVLVGTLSCGFVNCSCLYSEVWSDILGWCGNCGGCGTLT